MRIIDTHQRTHPKRKDVISNKKVLLRERKRHTARRVLSTPSVVLPGYPPPDRVSPPFWPSQGSTWPGYPQAGYPPSRVLPLSWPCWGGTWPGYPPAGYPPARYPPRLPHGILGNVAKHYGIWVPPLWTDRWTDRRMSKHYLPVVLR